MSLPQGGVRCGQGVGAPQENRYGWRDQRELDVRRIGKEAHSTWAGSLGRHGCGEASKHCDDAPGVGPDAGTQALPVLAHQIDGSDGGRRRRAPKSSLPWGRTAEARLI